MTNIETSTIYDKIVRSNFWVKHVAGKMEDDMVCYMIGYIVCIVENWWPQQYDLKVDDNFFNKMKIVWQSLSINQRKETVLTSQWFIRENLKLEDGKRLRIPSKWTEYVNFGGINPGDDPRDDRGIFVLCLYCYLSSILWLVVKIHRHYRRQK